MLADDEAARVAIAELVAQARVLLDQPGTLDRALTVQAQAFSEKARTAIEGAGGTATVVE